MAKKKSYGARGSEIGGTPHRQSGREKPQMGGDTSYRDSPAKPAAGANRFGFRKNPKQKSSPPNYKFRG